MQSNQFRNKNWFLSQPTLQKRGDEELKFENTGVRYWFHPKTAEVTYEVRSASEPWTIASRYKSSNLPTVKKKTPKSRS